MSCWTLLQAPGEAVLVTAGAPHQVLPQRVPVGPLQRAQSIRSSPQAVTPSVFSAELGRTGKSCLHWREEENPVVLKSSFTGHQAYWALLIP